jgi:hypothetical protein
MTLAQQFPDVSMLIREKQKLNLKHNAAELFKDIRYDTISTEEKSYDHEFTAPHYKQLIYGGLVFTGLFFLLLNARMILNWVIS